MSPLCRRDQIGSINLGSPVFFHGMEVGSVMSMALYNPDKGVSMLLFVQAPYVQRHCRARTDDLTGA
jgi:paraquat-inducible protein B